MSFLLWGTCDTHHHHNGLRVSGSSHLATVGEPLALSCNTATGVWKRGSVTITNTDASSRVFVTSGSTEIILNFSPFQSTDGETFTCEFNSSFKTSVTLREYIARRPQWRYCYLVSQSMLLV